MDDTERQLDLIPEVREGVEKHYKNADLIKAQVEKLLLKHLEPHQEFTEMGFIDTLRCVAHLRLGYYVEIVLRQNRHRPNEFDLAAVDATYEEMYKSEEVDKLLKKLSEVLERDATGKVFDVEGEEVEIKVNPKNELFN